MKVVGATLRDHSDLSPRGAPLADAVVGRSHTEFVHGKRRRRQHAVKRIPEEFVVIAHPIERNVVLIAALAVNHAGAGVVVILKLVFAVECYAGLQTEQKHVVFAGQGEVLNSIGTHGLADAGIGGVERRCFSGNGDHLSDCADTHLEIERRRKIHPQSYTRLLVFLEAFGFDSHSVHARKYFQERIQAVCARGRRATSIGLNIGEAYLCSDNRRVGRVCHCATERRSRLSPCARRV